MVFNPPHDAPLAAGDILIAIGDQVHLGRLEELAGAKTLREPGASARGGT
jgi:uncharacterized protein with PhoU and TrkA domain